MKASPSPLAIAIVGGESTGKSTLAQALGARCQLLVLDEVLRRFCVEQQRTPTAAEQAQIIAQQHLLEVDAHRAVAQQSQRRGWVADSTPLATAIYSQLYFDDDSLLEAALLHQQTYDLTLVTDTDLPWREDGFLRDGPAYRDAFHERLLGLLQRHRMPYQLIRGHGQARIEQAVQLLDRLLQ